MLDLPPTGEMRDGAHHFALRVYYEDTDFSGVVYHANYLKFIERARSEYLRVLGVNQGEMFAAQAAFMVRSLKIDYLKPAKIDDILMILTKPLTGKGASFTLSQAIFRDEMLLLSAEVQIVHVIHNKPARLPLLLRPIFTPF